MIGRIRSAYEWFVGGLAEALLWCLDRARPGSTCRIAIGTGPALVAAADGTRIGQITDPASGLRFDPPDLKIRLAGATVDITIPAGWLFRRKLDPVAQESVPFLDGFVRHQIERITPWRAADVYYHIQQSPVPGDAAHVAVEIGVVPHRLLKRWVDVLLPLGPRLLRVGPSEAGPDGTLRLLLGQSAAMRLPALRRKVVAALLILAAGYGAAMAGLWWQTDQLQADIEAQDHLMEERKLVLERAKRRDQAGQSLDARLQALRTTQAPAVEVVDALARALPDSAHLTDFTLEADHLAASGISTDTSVLVPALETSGRFADVAFGAATTQVQAGGGDRFHLEMRVVGRVAAAP